MHSGPQKMLQISGGKIGFSCCYNTELFSFMSDGGVSSNDYL